MRNPTFELETARGTLGLTVLGHPTPDAATFVDRNRLTIRITVKHPTAVTAVAEDIVYAGDFVRFSLEFDKIVRGNWEPSLYLGDGDPGPKRDELYLPMSGGRLAIAHRPTHFELSYRPTNEDAVAWQLALSGKEVRKLQSGIDQLYSGSFSFLKAVADVTPELSGETRQWVAHFVEELIDDWYYLDVDALRRRGWGAVICLKYWLTSDVLRTQQLLDAISRLGVSELLAYAFVENPDVPQLARIPVTLDGLIGYLDSVTYRPIDNVLFTTADATLAILVTHEDPMVVAGPPAFVREVFEGFFYEVRMEYRHESIRRFLHPRRLEMSNAAIIAMQDSVWDRDRQYTSLLGSSIPEPTVKRSSQKTDTTDGPA